MKRPATFEDIKGHSWLVEYLKDHISKGTLHHFLIFEGPEGLGKTSLADLIALSLVCGLEPSPKRTEMYKNVIVKGESNDNIKRFKCSVDGGKEAAKLIKDEMHAAFNLKGPKVIICDECHGLSDAAQDVFLAETEFLDDNVYVIMLTTEIGRLKASLRSRAVPIHLSPLSTSEMVSVLRTEVNERGLKLQSEQAMLTLLADWAQCKPRAGLNVLNAFADNSVVSANALRELIGYLEVGDVLPLLSSLSGSMTFGLRYISEMTVSNSIIDLVIECINIKSGNGSYKLNSSDVNKVREELTTVSVNQLIKFLYGLTKESTLTKTLLLNAYVSAHSSLSHLTKPAKDVEVLAQEDIQRADIAMQTVMESEAKAPTLDDLLTSSKIIN